MLTAAPSKDQKQRSAQELAALNRQVVHKLRQKTGFSESMQVNQHESLEIYGDEISETGQWWSTILNPTLHAEMNLFDLPMPVKHGDEPQSFGNYLEQVCKKNNIAVKLPEKKNGNHDLPVRVHLVDAAVPARTPVTRPVDSDVKTAKVNEASSCAIRPYFRNKTNQPTLTGSLVASLQPGPLDNPILYDEILFSHYLSGFEKFPPSKSEERKLPALICHKLPNQAAKSSDRSYDLLDDCYVVIRFPIEFDRKDYDEQIAANTRRNNCITAALQDPRFHWKRRAINAAALEHEAPQRPLEINRQVLDMSKIEVYLLKAHPVDVRAEDASKTVDELITATRNDMHRRASLWNDAFDSFVKRHHGTVIPPYKLPDRLHSAIETEIDRLESTCCPSFFSRGNKARHIRYALEKVKDFIARGGSFKTPLDALKAEINGISIYNALNYSRLNPFSNQPLWGETDALKNVLKECKDPLVKNEITPQR
jgi:hypothetical protein